MKILVTGANGFIGSNLCRHLIERGHDVVGLVRPSGDRRFLSGLAELHIFEGDITDRAGLDAAMEGVEIVHHVAGYSSDWGSWQAFRAGNVEGVRNVMEAARNAGVRRVVHVSSVSVYGFPGGTDLTEDTPFTARPNDRYITTKAEGERLAMDFNGRGIEVTAIRPGGVYGPHDRTTTAKLAPALEAGQFGHVDGGRHVMAPCYIDNLTAMMCLAGDSAAAPGEIFNAVDDGRTMWRQYIEWMCADLGCPPPRLSVPHALVWPVAVLMEGFGKAVRMKESPLINTYRIRAVMKDSHYSTAKAKRLLDWQPTISTREGITRAIDWYSKHHRQEAA
jgi:nucleoside-diphosphate-sugar epimerase